MQKPKYEFQFKHKKSRWLFFFANRMMIKLSQIVSIQAHPKGSLITTTTKPILVPMSVRRTIDELCVAHGSSLAGRLVFAKRVTGKQRMLPVFVSSQCILCPTGSLKSYETTVHNWFHLNGRSAMELPQSLLQAASEIALREPGDYAILKVLKGSQIHE
jgi:competence transcription factor ComK